MSYNSNKEPERDSLAVVVGIEHATCSVYDAVNFVENVPLAADGHFLMQTFNNVQSNIFGGGNIDIDIHIDGKSILGSQI